MLTWTLLVVAPSSVLQLAWLLVPNTYGLPRDRTTLAVTFTSMGTLLGFRLGHARDKCLELPHGQQSSRLTLCQLLLSLLSWPVLSPVLVQLLLVLSLLRLWGL
ncbi:hypothetical protein AAG570_010863 [Ranatra chinensis]|uniref:Uncharacterized protein n=1 Tax=Ranatra chinensis TaxID=642074 RepID=A0ABD0YJ67_9HEMI